jgi:alkyl hydroperoxide reductase subunit AhpF
MLSNDTRQFLHNALAKMVSPVRLVFFTQGRAAAERGRGVPADEEIGCEGCVPTGQILRDIASLSALITIEEHNLVLERERAATYRVHRAPTVAVVGDRDRGIRFAGAPGGYELMALVDAILLVSTGGSGLAPASRALLARVQGPLDIQVFVTPT